MRALFLASLSCAALLACAPTESPRPAHMEADQDAQASAALDRALAAPTRSPANVARDAWRHPKQTLSFFGVKPDMTVVEIWPGRGWYTEVLAPYLSAGGTLYLGAQPGRATEAIRALTESDSATYGKAIIVTFPGDANLPQGTADAVLTFRNAHNWVMAGDEVANEAFKSFYAMLKPGGILGVVDHRLPEDADSAREKTSGYTKVSTVKRLAAAAGFELVAESEINANPADTKDYEKGVWTLPPVLALGDQDRAKYLAIGESDRMTLKFRKPVK